MKKTMIQLTCLLLVSLLGLSLIGCEKSKKEESKRRADGDPMVFVNDTLMNGNQAIPASYFGEDSKWALDVKGFAEGPVGTVEQGFSGRIPVQLGQNPTKVVESYEPYKMVRSERGTWSLYQSGKAQNARFEFDSAGGMLSLSKIVENSIDLMVTEKFRVLHTSYSEDGQAMSFLISSDIPGKRRLLALYFYRWETWSTPAATTDENYQYAYGRGYKLAWARNRDLGIRVCGNVSKELKDMVGDAVRQWDKALDNTFNVNFVETDLPIMLNARFDESEKCPPFSDLRTQTVTYVDGWSRPSNGLGRAAGETITVGNFNKGTILDADVFILMDEMQKIVPDRLNVHDPRALAHWEVRQEFQLTALSELGRVLGLGPQTNGNSIMSNSKNATDLTDYDVEAIRALYPYQGFRFPF